MIAWSPNGSHLAIITGGGDTPTIQVLDSAGRKEMDLLTGWANMLAVWAPDSARLAWVSKDNVIRVKDITNGQELRAIEGESPYPYSALTNLAWSLDGSQLAAVYVQGLIRVWDISSGMELREFKKEVIAPYADFASAISWSPTGTQLAVVDNETISIWEGVPSD